MADLDRKDTNTAINKQDHDSNDDITPQTDPSNDSSKKLKKPNKRAIKRTTKKNKEEEIDTLTNNTTTTNDKKFSYENTEVVDPKKKKSRFPLARIKRIMQSDEDIGKVSMTAPVVLSRAIEIFIQDLVHTMIGDNMEVHGMRVEKNVFEKTISNDKKFDFLKMFLEKDNEEYLE